MSTTPERSPTTISNADADAMVGNVLLVLLAAQSKQTDLHAKYAPSYPAVKEADKEVADAKAALQSAESLKFSTQTTDRDPTHELVREDLAKTEADRDSQRARQEAMEASLTALKAKLVELDKLAIKRNDLVRDVRANEQNYLLYLSKREQERMSDALNNAKIANVAIVGAPTQPVLPNIGMPTLIVLVVFGAFIFSIIATYALAYTDSSVYTPDQVLEILDVPMVVAVRTVA